MTWAPLQATSTRVTLANCSQAGERKVPIVIVKHIQQLTMQRPYKDML